MYGTWKPPIAPDHVDSGLCFTRLKFCAGPWLSSELGRELQLIQHNASQKTSFHIIVKGLCLLLLVNEAKLVCAVK